MNELISKDLHSLVASESNQELYHNLTSLARHISGCRFSSLTLIAENTVWVKIETGVPSGVFNQKDFLLPENEILPGEYIIHDTLKEESYAKLSWVESAPFIRFCAGFSLKDETGKTIGYLNVYDSSPHTLSAAQINGMNMLAVQVIALLKKDTHTSRILEEALIKKEEEIKSLVIMAEHQKKFHEDILNKIPVDIAVFDQNHRYLFVNPTAIKNDTLRNYIIGKDDFEYAAYMKRDDTVPKIRRKYFLECVETKQVVKWEDTVIGRDGAKKTSLRSFFPIFDESENLAMVIGYSMDISDQKLLIEKQRLVEQLSLQNTQLVDFCNIVSHNLRGPLVNIEMLVKFIEESEDESEKTMMLSKLNIVIDSLHLTFNELVESIRIKQDYQVKSSNILLEDCIKHTLNQLQMEIKKTEVSVHSHFEEAKKAWFPSKYLYSIFYNLISNAIKYQSPDRKLEIVISSHVTTKNTLLITFKDNGLGIDLDKHKENIFKIGKVFHRHPNAKGIGLYMTKTQIEAMNGKIWVESKVNEGTTFYIELKQEIQ